MGKEKKKKKKNAQKFLIKKKKKKKKKKKNLNCIHIVITTTKWGRSQTGRNTRSLL